MENMSLVLENNFHVNVQLVKCVKYFSPQLSHCKKGYETQFLSAVSQGKHYRKNPTSQLKE